MTAPAEVDTRDTEPSGAAAVLSYAGAVVDTPAAGSDLSIAVDSRFVESWLCVYFDFQTDANVANRTVTLNVQDGDGKNLWRYQRSAVQAAGVTVAHTWSRKQQTEVVTGQFTLLPGFDFPLLPGWKVVTVTTNIQVGDQFKNVRVVRRRLSSHDMTDVDFNLIATQFFGS